MSDKNPVMGNLISYEAYLFVARERDQALKVRDRFCELLTRAQSDTEAALELAVAAERERDEFAASLRALMGVWESAEDECEAFRETLTRERKIGWGEAERMWAVRDAAQTRVAELESILQAWREKHDAEAYRDTGRLWEAQDAAADYHAAWVDAEEREEKALKAFADYIFFAAGRLSAVRTDRDNLLRERDEARELLEAADRRIRELNDMLADRDEVPLSLLRERDELKFALAGTENARNSAWRECERARKERDEATRAHSLEVAAHQVTAKRLEQAEACRDSLRRNEEWCGERVAWFGRQRDVERKAKEEAEQALRMAGCLASGRDQERDSERQSSRRARAIARLLWRRTYQDFNVIEPALYEQLGYENPWLTEAD